MTRSNRFLHGPFVVCLLLACEKSERAADPPPAAPSAPAEPAQPPEPAEPAPTAEPAATTAPGEPAPAAERAAKAVEPSTTSPAIRRSGGRDGRCAGRRWLRTPIHRARGRLARRSFRRARFGAFARSLDNQDLTALARGLHRAAKLAPDASWNAGANGWAAIANGAASAADSGELSTAKQACKTCHEAWRNKYKASFRARALAN